MEERRLPPARAPAAPPRRWTTAESCLCPQRGTVSDSEPRRVPEASWRETRARASSTPVVSARMRFVRSVASEATAVTTAEEPARIPSPLRNTGRAKPKEPPFSDGASTEEATERKPARSRAARTSSVPETGGERPKSITSGSDRRTTSLGGTRTVARRTAEPNPSTREESEEAGVKTSSACTASVPALERETFETKVLPRADVTWATEGTRKEASGRTAEAPRSEERSGASLSWTRRREVTPPFVRRVR